MSKAAKVAIGAAGGAAGAALMGQAHKLVQTLVGAMPPKGEDATEKVANSFATTFTGRKLKSDAKKTGGQIVHYAFGAAMGGLYALIADSLPAAAAGRGALFGLAVYAGAHALAVPALGLAFDPIENGAVQEGPEFLGHVVYGVTTDTVRRIFSRED